MNITFETICISITVCIICFLGGARAQFVYMNDNYGVETKLQQCEEFLPRNKHCEIVVKAQVINEEI